MIELIMLLAWMLPSLAVYRRVGFKVEEIQCRRHKDNRSLCSWCKCSNCGDYAYYHVGLYSHSRFRRGYGDGCANYTPSQYHYMSQFFALSAVLLAWPAIVTAYYTTAMAIRHGASKPQIAFFKAPTPIESKAQREKRLFDEREAEIARREADILAKEKELGIV